MMNIKEKSYQQLDRLSDRKNAGLTEPNETSFSPSEILKKRKDKVQKKMEWQKTIIVLLATAVIVYLLFGVMFGIAIVHGSSMSPTYQAGDLIFYNRLDDSYVASDVVLFETDEQQLLLKRIVGMPGEELDIDEGSGTVLISAMPLKESYIYQKTLKKKTITYPVDIDEDEYFVMGDQREDSYDSREFGTIEKQQIKGKVLAVFRR